MELDRRLHIGTSGWSYMHWKGPFYPEHLSREGMLSYYCERFRCVEINSCFYRLPAESALEHWYDATPADFRFAAKASRYITHMKKLKDPRETIGAFVQRIAVLGDKLGPILFQLPPRWHFDQARLAGFLKALSRQFRYAFEFRDPSWHNDETYALLGKHNAAFCIYHLDGFVAPEVITTDFVYLRLHGPDGAYKGCYDESSLSTWGEKIRRWAADGRIVHCYFDNDQDGHAPRNAQRLQTIVGGTSTGS